MEKPMGFDNVQEFGEFKKLKKGGYICSIRKVEETTSKNGNDMVLIYLEIADGEFRNYYSEKYSNDTRPDRKWGAIIHQVVYDTTTKQTSRGFKSFITSVEKSNPGWVNSQIWNDNFCQYFKGKFIGCIFGDYHYINSVGEPAVYAKPVRLCSTDSIKKNDFKIPEDEYAPNYHEALKNGSKLSMAATNQAAGFDGFEPADITMDDLPF